MDGNRRFSNKCNFENVQGHKMGADKLMEIFHLCNQIGIAEITVYAFSIENFNRSKEEVNNLMDLINKYLDQLYLEKDHLMKSGMRIRAFGKLSLLPKTLQKCVAQLILLSANNTKTTLNLCLAYTSQEEMCQAVKEIANAAKIGLIEPEDISEAVLGKCLYSSGSSHPELLIRTSGEVRLSNFLLWQRNCLKTQECQEEAIKKTQMRQNELYRKTVLGTFIAKYQIEDATEENTTEEVEKIVRNRENRIKKLSHFIESKRTQMFKDMLVY